MGDHNKTKAQLIDEVEALRARVAALEQAAAEQQTIERTLRRDRDTFIRIAETGAIGITVVDTSGQITFANVQAERILGLGKDKITQRTYNNPAWCITDYDGNPLPDESLPFRRVIDTHQSVYDVRHAVEWPDGRRVLLSVNAAPLFDAEDQLRGVVATIDDVTAHVQADNALRESRERYQLLFSTMLDGYALHEIICDDDGTPIDYRFLDVNPAWERATGLHRSDVLGRTVREVLPGIESYWIETFGQVALTGEAVKFENRAEDLGGRWFECLAFSPQPQQFAVIFQDVTDRRQAEGALRESEARYRRLFEDSPMALFEEDGSAVKHMIDRLRAAGVEDLQAYFVAHPETLLECIGAIKIVDVSRASLELFGASDMEELVQNAGAMFGEESLPALREEIVAFASGQSRFEGEGVVQTLSGEKRQVVINSSIMPGHEDTWARVSVTIMDVTESRGAAQAAQRARQQLQDMFDNAPAVVYAKDMAGRYIFINRAWRDRSGLGERPVLRKTDCEVFNYLDVWQSHELAVLAADHAVTFEEVGIRTQSAYLATKFLLRDERGTPFALCNISIDITERKRAEETAQRAQQQLSDILHHTPAVVYAKDMQGRFIMANQEWRNKTGFGETEIVGKTGPELFPALYDGDEVWFPHEQDVIESGQAITHEEIGRNTGNSYLATKFLLRDTSGQPYALCNISLDITEHKRAEEAVLRAQHQLQDIFDNTPAVVYVKDLNGHYIFVNREWRLRSQRLDVDVIGHTPGELFSDFGFVEGKWDAAEKQVLESGETVYIEQIGQTTGKTYLATKFLLRDADGQPYALCSSSVDISDRKQIEDEREILLAQIREQAQQVQQIISTVPEGVILLDADKTVMLANPVAEGDLRTLAGVTVGQTLRSLGNRSLDEVLTSPPKGFWHEVESAGSRTFEVIARPIETGSAPGGWVIVIRDVTQERMIQRRVQQQERLAAVGQLAAGIAHDFNNIIAVIVLYAQIIRQTTALPPKAQEKLQTIVEQAHRATDLIEQVLDFSRRSALERRPMDLLLFLKEQVKLLERTLPENIAVKLTYEPADSYVANADPTRIQQTIMNLVVNARDAMPEGGELRLDLDLCTFERETTPLPDMTPGQWIRLAVSDTGTGIAPDVLPHVFEPFFTTKGPGQGTGLGLAQVYGIVRQHDGHIDLFSRPGQGTTFTLYFPYGAEQTEAPVLDGETLVRGHGETILVVEDDAAIRSALSASLELLNYRVLAARNGAEALALWDANRAVIALVLSDVVMPEMGGIALFYALQQRDPSVKVMLLTGHMLEQHLEDQLKILKARGLAEWMQKPPALAKLAETLARILRGGDF
jgi:two-component system cell cycle sensor histidine kinase/response regulator CckA